jgi:hypothetical protein
VRVLEWLVAPGAIAFSAALVLMALVGVVEALGLGAGAVDLDLDADGGLLDWLGVGQVPVLVLLVAFLAAFGGLGLAGQQAALTLTGAFLSPWIAVPAALVTALPATALLARGLAHILPRDETTAFDVEDLVGRAGTITVGRAREGSPARTRVLDPHGQAHHVLVEPNDPAEIFEEGDTVRLVRREGDRFRAILHVSPRLTDWMNP